MNVNGFHCQGSTVSIQLPPTAAGGKDIENLPRAPEMMVFRGRLQRTQAHKRLLSNFVATLAQQSGWPVYPPSSVLDLLALELSVIGRNMQELDIRK